MGRILPSSGHAEDAGSRTTVAKTPRFQFSHDLRTALTHLYDPSVLHASPLLPLLHVDRQSNQVWALQRALTRAIEALRPTAGSPADSRGWRIYQILHSRYVEQSSQREVANDLSLSIRQLRREERSAREVLADHLWTQYDIEASILASSSGTDIPDHTSDERETPPLSRSRELEWLRDSVPVQATNVQDVIQCVLDTARPLLDRADVTPHFTAPPEVPALPLQEPILRQALLHIVSAMVQCAPQGGLHLSLSMRAGGVSISVRTCTGESQAAAMLAECNESLDTASQLLSLSGGSLELLVGPGSGAAPYHSEQCSVEALVRLAAGEQLTILAVDDNADALQLFQRYLSGSRYHFVGAQDAREGLALATDLRPQVILLDVMLPGQDGWQLLGKLREHPQTRTIPVIVCTILAQRELAFALGAADFVRKPVSRADMLAALDRQMVSRAREFH